MWDLNGLEVLILVLVLIVPALLIVCVILLVAKASRTPASAGASPSKKTPAGWYEDPISPGQRRYWDGAGWTEHVAADG